MTAFPARPDRSAALPLFLGAGAAGFGLGLLALALTDPPRIVEALPPPSAPPRVAASTAAPESRIRATGWPPVFGIRAPEPVALEPEPVTIPEPEPEPLEDYDEGDIEIEAYRLQGLIVEGDTGMALIESEDGVSVYRVGDILPGGEELVAIEDAGVEVEIEGISFFVGFDEAEPGGGRPASGRRRSADDMDDLDRMDESDYYEDYEYDRTGEADMDMITNPPRTTRAPRDPQTGRPLRHGPIGTTPGGR